MRDLFEGPLCVYRFLADQLLNLVQEQWIIENQPVSLQDGDELRPDLLGGVFRQLSEVLPGAGRCLSEFSDLWLDLGIGERHAHDWQRPVLDHQWPADGDPRGDTNTNQSLGVAHSDSPKRSRIKRSRDSSAALSSVPDAVIVSVEPQGAARRRSPKIDLPFTSSSLKRTSTCALNREAV